MLWERENKRGYQFEDGEVRVFAKPYFELLQPAENPDPVLRHQLREKAVANGELEASHATRLGSGRKPAAPLPTLDDQVAVFEGLFPDGFHGDEWTDKHRQRPDGRRLKRHRDPAIAEAAEKLGAEALQACIDAGNYAEVYGRLLEVIGNTDLATRKQLDGFRRLRVDAELAQAMYGFLHDVRSGELNTMARLRRALARQDFRKIPWTALTAPRALLFPHDHLCVRPSVVRAQAKLISPRFKPASVPSASDYAQCLEMVMGVRKHLTTVGFSPRDLFDVAMFMRLTLSGPSKRSLVEAMVQRRAAAQAEEDEQPLRAVQEAAAASKPQEQAAAATQ